MTEIVLILGLLIIPAVVVRVVEALNRRDTYRAPLAHNRGGGSAEYSDNQHSVTHKGHSNSLRGN